MLIAVLVIEALLLVAVGILLFRKSSLDPTPVVDSVREELQLMRSEARDAERALREELVSNLERLGERLARASKESADAQKQALAEVRAQVKELTEANERRMGKVQETLEKRLDALSSNNEKKLDQMREVVEEKLQSTLEKRIGESFKRVSENLEAVQRGLGEMQTLASDVGGLQRVLTNVKVRGTWGEVQLSAILEQLLTAEQYERNVKVKPDTNDIVEFAIKLPGQGKSDKSIYLPIDSKFPQEDYQRLLDASERADQEEVDRAMKSLQLSIRDEAKKIKEKYVHPPHTTDFGILFLPTEGLYAEVIRQQALMDELLTTHRVVVAGPTTLSAILSSLRMGFRTLAIEKRSSEVWEVLAGVKTEFGKFGDVLAKIKKQIGTVSNTIESAETRTRAMDRKLKDVESLDQDKASELLSLEGLTGKDMDEQE
ncbi:MAG: DNA recombination protein RmuC [Gammaproteobacteria bacterium]|nr:DNA recombination protein RmuC [Gammaproteobacteria bacterium]